MVATRMPLLEHPAAIPGYRLLEVLDRRPGVSSTYHATDLRLERSVALTIMGAQLNHDAAYAARFLKEMPRLADVEHPHLVGVLTAGAGKRGLFLVKELTDATPLDVLLAAGRLERRDLLAILEQVADALETVHRRKLLHRDLRPRSMLVDGDGRARLDDVGLGHPLALHEHDPEGLAYAAPEVLLGSRATAHGDLYSLGTILYESLTGRRPYPTENLMQSPRQLAAARTATPPPRLGEQRPDLPAALDHVVRRALAHEPRKRKEGPVALVAHAREALVEAGSTPPPAATRRPPSTPAAAQEAGARGDDRVAARGHDRVAARGHDRVAARGDERVAGQGVERVAARGDARVARRGAARGRAQVGATAPRASRRLVVALAVAAAALAAGLLGSAITSGDGGDEAPSSSAPAPAPASATLSTGVFRLTHPASWVRVREEAGLPGLDLPGAVHLRPDETSGFEPGEAGLLAVVAPRVDAGLLSPQLAVALPDRPRATRVRIGRALGLRYLGLIPGDAARRANVYAVPTSAGVVTVACFAQVATREFLPACEGVANTLALQDAQAYPLGPDPGYARVLNATMRRLDSARRRERAILRSARTARGQARSAARLAAAYRVAAAAQGRAPRRPSSALLNEQLVTRLRDTGRAYVSMARAARANDADAFASATAAVRRNEAALQAGLRALAAAGYAVG